MKTKIKETVNNQFRVLWSDNECLRGGYEDFNSKALAENYIKRGADFVSVSTLLFNPFKFSLFYLNMCLHM